MSGIRFVLHGDWGWFLAEYKRDEELCRQYVEQMVEVWVSEWGADRERVDLEGFKDSAMGELYDHYRSGRPITPYTEQAAEWLALSPEECGLTPFCIRVTYGPNDRLIPHRARTPYDVACYEFMLDVMAELRDFDDFPTELIEKIDRDYLVARSVRAYLQYDDDPHIEAAAIADRVELLDQLCTIRLVFSL